MAIRITQGMIYDKYVNQMQSSLGAYMDSSEQGSTQKKINRPSDDPAGMYKVLKLRNTQTFNTQLLENCDTAKGWLQMEDSILSTQMPTVITQIKALAEQAATGTYTAEQRQSIAFQVRQQLGSLINMANSEFDGKSLFAGHKYLTPAFQEGLSLMSENDSIASLIKSGATQVQGAGKETIAFQFTQDGYLSDALTYRWSKDGGDTWQTGTSTVNGTTTTLSFDGVSVTMTNVLSDGDTTEKIAIEAVDTSENALGLHKETVYIRPGIFYQGDVNDDLEITYMGAGQSENEDVTDYLEADAHGTFTSNTLIRLKSFVADGATEPSKSIPANTAGTLTWEYSVDNGMNWVTGTAQLSAFQTVSSTSDDSDSTSSDDTTIDTDDEQTTDKETDGVAVPVRFALPEGYVDLTISKGIKNGTQILIHPDDANLDYEIMKDTHISVNAVGKDIFGGIYENKPAIDSEKNLFEIVGDFIAYLETNNQDGCGESLVLLGNAEQHLLTEAARVGGLENRIDIAYDVLQSQKLDIKERLSYIEDIELTDLLVKMQQQQITYQTVLQSASKIMNLSLANYL